MDAVRSRVRDPEGTRTAVLEAATELFGRLGYAGTSIRAVARRSGASAPLIVHHFGSKEGLYREVKRRGIDRFRKARRVRLDKQGSSPLGEAVEDLFRFFGENLAVSRLASRARLEGNTLWPGDAEVLDSLAERVRRAQESGRVRKDLDPALLAVMLEALAEYWWENRERIRSLLKPEGKDPDLDESYLEQMVDVLLRGTKDGETRGHEAESPRGPGEETTVLALLRSPSPAVLPATRAAGGEHP